MLTETLVSAIFLSDVHLEDANGSKTQLVIRFFEEVVRRHSRLFILGDLFDVWPGTDAHLTQRFAPVLKTIKGLVEGGCEVHYVEGNHDFCLGDYFSKKLGVKIHTGEFEISLGGRRVMLTHGDLGNPKDVGYRVFRSVLRMKTVQAMRCSVPGAWVYELGRRTSRLSRNYHRPLDLTRESEIKSIYRRSADRYFAGGFDLVVMGHTHLPDDYQVRMDERDCRYINLGDWVKNFTYLEFDGNGFYTKRHPIVSTT